MDYGNLQIMAMMKAKMAYHSKRQDVLAQNVANTDTPGYRPKDLPPLTFDDMLGKQKRLKMVQTSPEHLGGAHTQIAAFSPEVMQQYYEKKPVNNAVTAEQQMMMMNENALELQTTTQLYNKTAGLFRTAIGNRQ